VVVFIFKKIGTFHGSMAGNIVVGKEVWIPKTQLKYCDLFFNKRRRSKTKN
jgi:hypothetical protein